MIEDLTGRVPREMKFLNNAASVAKFSENRRADFKRSLTKAFNTLSSTEKQSCIANLDKLIGYKLLDNSPTEFDEAVLDAGLIFKEQDSGSFKALSLVALDSLLLFLLQNMREVRPVSYFVCSILFHFTTLTICAFSCQVLNKVMHLSDI